MIWVGNCVSGMKIYTLSDLPRAKYFEGFMRKQDIYHF